MADIKTNLKIKTASNTYTQKYPKSKAEIVRRDTTQISNIVGTTLEECLQYISNTYCPMNGKSWVEYTLPATSGAKAVCSDGNFLFVKVGSKFKWSFDGGRTFTGQGELSSFADATVLNCKKTKSQGIAYSYHVVAADNKKIHSIRIDNNDTFISYVNADVNTTITTPISTFFTDGLWYVFGADKIATIADLDGGVATETSPTSHTHMTQAIYAPDMGMYITVDNGVCVVSNVKVGES